MNRKLKEELINITKKEIKGEDTSHDFEHALRVLSTAERIAKRRTKFLKEFLSELKLELKGR